MVQQLLVWCSKELTRTSLLPKNILLYLCFFEKQLAKRLTHFLAFSISCFSLGVGANSGRIQWFCMAWVYIKIVDWYTVVLYIICQLLWIVIRRRDLVYSGTTLMSVAKMKDQPINRQPVTKRLKSKNLRWAKGWQEICVHGSYPDCRVHTERKTIFGIVWRGVPPLKLGRTKQGAVDRWVGSSMSKFPRHVCCKSFQSPIPTHTHIHTPVYSYTAGWYLICPNNISMSKCGMHSICFTQSFLNESPGPKPWPSPLKKASDVVFSVIKTGV